MKECKDSGWRKIVMLKVEGVERVHKLRYILEDVVGCGVEGEKE